MVSEFCALHAVAIEITATIQESEQGGGDLVPQGEETEEQYGEDNKH